jgi:REP element-mobilizing transposase RayT
MLRGVNRDAIFLEDADCDRFLHSLAEAKEASGCCVLAYCLMTNHVHLVLRTTDEPIGTVVKRLGVRYAGWFNRKYGRVGHLFQDRFASVPVEDDAYFLTLLRYVWNNPVEAGLATRADEYRWSSRRFLGEETDLLDQSELSSLLPEYSLTEIAPISLTLLGGGTGKTGRPRRHTAEQVTALLRNACGADSPEAFGRLSRSTQRLVVCELRTRSVTYEQIAKATGLSPSGARRIHLDDSKPSFEASA